MLGIGVELRAGDVGGVTSDAKSRRGRVASGGLTQVLGRSASGTTYE